MRTDNIEEIHEIVSPSLEPNDLPHEPMDAEVNPPTSEDAISPVQSSNILPEIESTVSQVNAEESLWVDSEDKEATEKPTHAVEDETTDLYLDSVNDELHDETLTETERADVNVNENEIETNVINSDVNNANVRHGKKVKADHTTEKISQFPLGRIKDIIKSDPDINIVSAECVFLISKATEMFLQRLGKEIHAVTLRNKKKTLQKRDLDAAISENPAFEFLEGALN